MPPAKEIERALGAIQSDDRQGLERILADGLHPDARTNWFQNRPMYTGEAYTLLMVAAATGRAGIVEFLLERGADPTALNSRGMQALDLAHLFRDRSPAVYESLLESRPERDIKERRAAVEKNLPAELIEFLDEDRSFACELEAGSGSFCRPERVRFVELKHEDPHGEEAHVYTFPCLDLIQTGQEVFFPGLLVYVPALGVFGTHDGDHDDLLVFIDRGWSRISADLCVYLNAQWEGPDEETGRLPLHKAFDHATLARHFAFEFYGEDD